MYAGTPFSAKMPRMPCTIALAIVLRCPYTRSRSLMRMSSVAFMPASVIGLPL